MDKRCVRDPQASSKYKVALDHAEAFVFDVKGDTLTTGTSDLLTPNMDASSPVRKVMQHGRFFIRKANKAYNLLGTPLSQ